MLRRALLSIFLSCTFFQIIQAQVTISLPANPLSAPISYAEYFIDTDPGYGSGTPIPVTTFTDINVNNFSLNISSISAGVHRIYFRTKDVNGAWSMNNEKTFFKLFPNANLPANTSPTNITKVEYFVDIDPGFGKGITIPITSSNDVSANSSSLDISSYNQGVHQIYFRSQDAKGSWSESNVQTFFIANVTAQIPSNPLPVSIVKMEYFIDTDPGFGKGKSISISSSADVSASNVAIDLSSLGNGVHYIYLRSQDANGNWSETNEQIFNILLANVIIPSNPVAGTITKFEYFFDKDPGFGKGTTITIAPTTGLNNYTFAANITGLKDDSTHTLYIRTFDDWSMTNTQTFVIGTVMPVTWISFNAKAINNKVQLDWKTAHETNTDRFDVERSADGVNFSKIGAVAASQNSSTESDFSFEDEQALSGTSYYRLKQVDIDGQFTYSIVISVKMNTQLSVKIIGNPVHNNLHFLVSGVIRKDFQLSILDVTGKRYKSITGVDGSQQLNVSDLSAGMYFLEYQLDGKVFSIPFTKQ